MTPTAISQTLRDDTLPVPVLLFTGIECKHFDMQFAVDTNDIVFHFYPKKGTTQNFWLKVFPEVVEPLVMDFFNDKFPALKMAFTPELSSWWLRANGKAVIGDPGLKAKRLSELINDALDAHN